MVYTHTHTIEYCSAIKKHKILPSAAAWMDLEIIILKEVSQKEKSKYIQCHLYEESKTRHK